MKMRTALFTMSSFVLTSAVIANAWLQKQQFYPTVVYLTKSSPCLAVLYIQAMVIIYLLGKLMKKIFFGNLRPAETEHLIERSWYAITDTCLAFTMFRDDFNPLFVASFVLLLFLKSFHWLLDDRVDYMERSPIISILFKLRVMSLFCVLMISDSVLVYYATTSVLAKGASVQLVFGFEYLVLGVLLISIFMKYILHLIDLQSENPWENKAVYMLYVELFTGFLRVVFFLGFTCIMMKVHTFPLFCIRPMYLTLRQFKKAVSDIVLSRRAIQNMNTLYPDATAEELAAADSTCIICREEMVAPEEGDQQPQSVCKKLPCGHIFHASCLRSWFQRQQTCPTCRRDVLQDTNNPVTDPNAARANNMERQAQQQQQAPQPQPGQPPLPPPNPFANFYAPMYGAPPPPVPPAANMPPQPPQQPPQQPPSSGEEAQQQQHQVPLPPLPPHGFPPMPFPMPPPPPPPQPPAVPLDLTGMSEEQLRAMEGNERRNVEARIECLRNIQVLLDVAMHNIQHYMATTNSTTLNLNNLTTSNSSEARQESTKQQETVIETKKEKEEPTCSSTPDKPTEQLPSTSDTLDAANDDREQTASSGDEDDEPSMTELRRRRLAHFQQKTSDQEESE